MIKKIYKTIDTVTGPLIAADKLRGVGYGEICKVMLADGSERFGEVLKIQGERAIIQVLEGTSGIDTTKASVMPTGEAAKISLTDKMLGRVFNGLGEPIDGLGRIEGEIELSIEGAAINPAARDKPDDFIETGISAIDLLNTITRGQKLPIFSSSGLPANELSMQVVREARLKSGDSQNSNESSSEDSHNDREFAIVFGAMGITFREASFFKESLKSTGALKRTVSFLNLADDSAVERLYTPRVALTTAEYLAFEKGYEVLVILTDMTAYSDALREISNAREEIPGRRSYPGYMYTDLASIYERAGRIIGKPGSVTLMPILTMPEDDITHPIPDLTGYITEGQIVLSRELHQKGIYPPIDVLPSLSRLMNLAIGEGKTRGNHRKVSDELYRSYAKGKEVRRLVSIVGEEGLTETDKKFLQFADAFEKNFIGQGSGRRTIGESFDEAFKLFEMLPGTRLKP